MYLPALIKIAPLGMQHHLFSIKMLKRRVGKRPFTEGFKQKEQKTHGEKIKNFPPSKTIVNENLL